VLPSTISRYVIKGMNIKLKITTALFLAAVAGIGFGAGYAAYDHHKESENKTLQENNEASLREKKLQSIMERTSKIGQYSRQIRKWRDAVMAISDEIALRELKECRDSGKLGWMDGSVNYNNSENSDTINISLYICYEPSTRFDQNLSRFELERKNILNEISMLSNIQNDVQ